MAMNVSLTPELERYVNQRSRAASTRPPAKWCERACGSSRRERICTGRRSRSCVASSRPASTRPTAGSYPRWTPKAR